ncbi:type II toxin-antitoxin system Phd/YefM family antitoxin [uncultured Enterovirga sp.]|uniref:type II toxin-antitoxin system Phd/YefM family antitoxin n=1 Tax=uncultured Enterovirga sp. TaxID=2026352 RepID=UPI0035CBDF9C
MRTITAADANRYFSKLLRDVSAGETVVVTSHGRPVMRVVPIEREEPARIEADRQKAWEEHIDHLRSQPALNIPITWTRDDIYDDDF